MATYYYITSFQWELGPKVNQRTVKPGPLRKGAVIGAGIMGTGITMSMLNAGIPVILVEQSPEVKFIYVYYRAYMGFAWASVRKNCLAHENPIHLSTRQQGITIS